MTDRVMKTLGTYLRLERYDTGTAGSGTAARASLLWREPIETFQLPSVLDLNAASVLREHFIGRRGSALRVDASRVERLGGLCLQVLIAAQAAWAEDRHDLVFDDVSSELQAGLDVFGVLPLALNYREE